MKTHLFLQARVSSTRLPYKAMLPLEDKLVLNHVLKRLKKVKVEKHVLLTDLESKDYFESIAQKEGFEIFVGHESDVLKRFCDAINKYQSEIVIRATGDNPLVFFELIPQLLEKFEPTFDYLTYKGMPKGAGVEIVKASSLLQAGKETKKEYDREHVCPYLYTNSKFKAVFLDAPSEYTSDFSITLDTDEDFERIKKIYSKLYPKRVNGVIPSNIIMEYIKGL